MGQYYKEKKQKVNTVAAANHKKRLECMTVLIKYFKKPESSTEPIQYLLTTEIMAILFFYTPQYRGIWSARFIGQQLANIGIKKVSTRTAQGSAERWHVVVKVSQHSERTVFYINETNAGKKLYRKRIVCAQIRSIVSHLKGRHTLEELTGLILSRYPEFKFGTNKELMVEIAKIAAVYKLESSYVID